MHGRANADDGTDSAGHRARLRKRLLDAGPEGFHDYELIEYLRPSRYAESDKLAAIAMREFSSLTTSRLTWPM